MSDKNLETAREIAIHFLRSVHSDTPLMRRALSESIASALQAARAEAHPASNELIQRLDHRILELEAKLKSVEVSDEELEKLSLEKFYTTLDDKKEFDEANWAFQQGFRKARSIRAIRMWPSENQLANFCRNYPKEDDDFEYVSPHAVFWWLKSQLIEDKDV